jgi:CheY-like chemotaxis protein
MTHAQNHTILLAEDDRSARDATAMVLEAEGYHVVTAGNGTSALNMLMQDSTIDLLVSDIHMPGGIDGIELALRARRHRPIQVMLISADPRSSFAHFPENTTFLAKPYDRRALLGAVGGLLGIASV